MRLKQLMAMVFAMALPLCAGSNWIYGGGTTVDGERLISFIDLDSVVQTPKGCRFRV